MVLQYRTRDACLKALEGFFVTMEWPDGRQAWGELGVFHNAVELIYPTPHVTGSHTETSFILYKPQFVELYALKRFHDELGEKNQVRREKDIRKSYNPNLFRRTRRRIRNFFNLTRDAFGQALGLFIGQAKKTSASALLQTQDARIASTAQQILGSGAAAYEPILEKYIGRKVVLEVAHDGKTQEYCGILKEYTGEFLFILDMMWEHEFAFDLAEPEQLKINHHLDFDVSESIDAGAATISVSVHNRGAHSVELGRVQGADFRKDWDHLLPPGESASVEIPNVPVAALDGADGDAPPQSPLSGAALHIRTRRNMDLVVPRSRGVIRHAAEEMNNGSLRFL
jgi:hypothetical protein